MCAVCVDMESHRGTDTDLKCWGLRACRTRRKAGKESSGYCSGTKIRHLAATANVSTRNGISVEVVDEEILRLASLFLAWFGLDWNVIAGKRG
jgi:hypothetical protein